MKIDSLQIFGRILKFGKPYKRYFVFSLFFMFLNTIFEGVSIFSIVPLMDKVLTGKKIVINTSINVPYLNKLNDFLAYLSSMDRMKVFNLIAIFMVAVTLIKGIAYFYSHVYMEKLGQHMVKDIRCKLFSHLENMSLDFFSSGKTGVLMSRITSDVQMILEMVSGRFATTLIELPKFIVYAAIIVVLDWKLVVMLLFLPVLILPIILIGKKIRSLSRRGQTRLAELNSILFEVITGIKIVQAFSMEDMELKRFIKQNMEYYKTRIKTIKLDTILNPITEITGIVVCVAIMLIRIPKIIDGTLSIGTFTLQAAAIVAMVKPIKTLGKINALFQRAIGAAERIFDILDVKSSIVDDPDPVYIKEFNNKIAFDGVWFKYERDDEAKHILENINFEIKKGEVAAFVGPSGGGKTTVLNLVPRFYDPEKGKITVDGIDLKKLSLKSMRKLIGIVTQETVLFNDTVLGNISYGEADIAPDDVVNAAKMANAHDFIKKLPEGYNTIIGEKGVKLSGGQKQRLSIARAILKNPSILILDEATSALDSESEKLVQEAINRLMEKRTVLVVAHRLSTIMHADKIFVIDKGQIIDCGTHQSLLSTSPLYQKLYEMQFDMNSKE